MVNSLSLITTPIELHKEDKTISYGTGFYYKGTWNGIDQIFLVTNYHVVTGNSPEQRHLEPQGDSLVFYCHYDESDPSHVVGIKMPLFTYSGKRVWLEHQNSIIDIAVIPIMFSLPVVVPAWSTVAKSLIEADMDISVTDSITLIGYPRMFFDDKNALPIYKTGNVASEYDHDFKGNPYFIIDISAFSGNSGSPVFSIRKNAQVISDQIIIKAQGNVTKFLGVYSAGIVHKDPIPIQKIRAIKEGIILDVDLQLGVVWKARLIDEIITQNSYQYSSEITKELAEKGNFKFQVSKGLYLF